MQSGIHQLCGGHQKIRKYAHKILMKHFCSDIQNAKEEIKSLIQQTSPCFFDCVSDGRPL